MRPHNFDNHAEDPTTQALQRSPLARKCPARYSQILPNPPSCKRDAIAHTTIWTSLLPIELIYLITDIYFSDDLETLKAFAGTCKILSSYCRQYIYRTVIVSPRNAKVVNEPSFPERFARLVVQVPHSGPHPKSSYHDAKP
ncbi:hypothetical protein BYT27DRAFT_7255221 [Phlegmacium glaucopus]|nr:hypothetical protein BYT27DRAFT_7255221 [Phlegmacium glaucopus]